MADHPIWRGHLRLALVSCPVVLYSAHREAANLHFNLINPKTGHRIRMVTQDADSGEEIPRRDLVKGYEFKKDNFLLLTDDDFDSARIDTNTTLTIGKFVDADSIDPLYYESSYYMAPDGDSGSDVYLVLRDAFEKSKRIALSRIVINRRERPVAILPHASGLILHTLYQSREIVDATPYFHDIPSAKPDPDMVALAEQLITRQKGTFAAQDNEDRYETRLRDVINAKLKGEGIEQATDEPEDHSNVVDLMALLKQSLGTPKHPPKTRRRAR